MTAAQYDLARTLPLLARLVEDDRFPFPGVPDSRELGPEWEGPLVDSASIGTAWRHKPTGVLWRVYIGPVGYSHVLPDLDDPDTLTALQGLGEHLDKLWRDRDGWWVLVAQRPSQVPPHRLGPYIIAVEGTKGAALVAGVLRQWGRHV